MNKIDKVVLKTMKENNTIKTTPELLPYLKKIQEEYTKDVIKQRENAKKEAQKFADRLKIPKELVSGVTPISRNRTCLRIPYLENDIEISEEWDSLYRCDKIYYHYRDIKCPSLMDLLKWILDNKKIEAE